MKHALLRKYHCGQLMQSWQMCHSKDGVFQLQLHPSGASQIVRKCLLCGAYLRSTKASVGSVTGDVGLAAEAHHAHVGDLVGVVNMHHSSFHDGCAQVQAVAGVVIQLTVQGLHLAILVECNLKASQT